MGALIDDISRVIASPVSRRHAFKMVTGSVGGAVLASLGFGRAARAQGSQADSCRDGEVRCNGRCYPPGSKCCGVGVCSDRQTCCSNTHCCDGEQNCCGSSCCPKSRNCCGEICCSVRTDCCGTHACCPRPRACCNDTCCRPFAACCGGTTCCPPGSYCCGTECQRERPSPSTGCVPVPRPHFPF
jgi:hypothetical protein